MQPEAEAKGHSEAEEGKPGIPSAKDGPGGNKLCQHTTVLKLMSIFVCFAAAKPRLAQLTLLKTTERQKVQIIRHLAPEWKDFGIYLDFDPDGRTLDLIEVEQKMNGPVACCRAMFQHWLAGNGVPATWDTLMELLQDAEQSHLAEQIKGVLGL